MSSLNGSALSLADYMKGLMDDDDEDWPDFEDNGKQPQFITRFSDIRTRKTVEIGVVTEYLPQWTCKEAFREVYQNWRDGILRSFSIPLRRFSPKHSERTGLILIEKLHPDSGEVLGYIRFKYNKEGFGQLEVTNFRASLEYRHLKIGATSKANDDQQAGSHGEGFKMAALVFRRFPNNHTFRIETSSVSCNFIFNPGLDLACTITRMSQGKLAAAKQKSEGKSRPLAADPSKDVSIFIGELRTGITSMGTETRGNKIHVDDFRKWLKVTLDINPPTDIVRTDCGELIMDSTYKNQFYLMGLNLPSGSISGKPHRYGYNFTKGETHRDRDSLSKPGQEARQICAIWTAAILAGGDKSLELLATWTDLLINSLNQVGDVSLNNYRLWLNGDLIKQVWAHMRTINNSDDGRSAFYFTPTDGKDVAHMITHSLKRHPVPLSAELWDILRWFELPRTPQEEQHRRFARATVIETPPNMFAKNVEWMLQCCIQSHPEGQSMNFEFVDGEALSIDAAFFRPTWKIHSKWLTFEGTHQNTFCEQKCPDESDPFCCDHAVLSIWNDMLIQLSALDESSSLTKNMAYTNSKTAAQILQMPRGTKCARNEKKGQLVISWESVDSHRNRTKPVRVVLHHDECTDEPLTSWKHPRNIMFNTTSEEPACHCPSQVSEMGKLRVTFKNLDPRFRYFPSVSRDIEGAFIALHPPSIRPLQEDIPVKVEPLSSRAANAPNTPKPVHYISSSSSSPMPYQQPSVATDNDSDEDDNGMGGDDSGSLYADSARASSLSRPSATANSKPQTSQPSRHTQGLGTDDEQTFTKDGASHTQRRGTKLTIDVINPFYPFESYAVGEEIDVQDLPWSSGFPGSHRFYRTVSEQHKNTFIAKARTDNLNQNGKRHQNGPAEERLSKQPRGNYNNSEQTSEQCPPSRSSSPTRQIYEELENYDFGLSPAPSVVRSVRQLSSSKTPVPPGGIVYRY